MDAAGRATETLAEALDAGRPAYAALLELAESIEDEWSYVNDLATAWTERLAEVEADRGDARPDAALVTAVAALAAEATSITDPHQAIDWLSTYPQVLLVALGEPL